MKYYWLLRSNMNFCPIYLEIEMFSWVEFEIDGGGEAEKPKVAWGNSGEENLFDEAIKFPESVQ